MRSMQCVGVGVSDTLCVSLCVSTAVCTCALGSEKYLYVWEWVDGYDVGVYKYLWTTGDSKEYLYMQRYLGLWCWVSSDQDKTLEN